MAIILSGGTQRTDFPVLFPPSTQFQPHVLVVYILEHKYMPLVNGGIILKWMIMNMYTLENLMLPR